MRGVVFALALAMASGCAFSTASSMIGSSRAQRRIDTEVCIEETPGRCTRTVKVARDVPARRFGGGYASFFNPAYAHLGRDRGDRHRFGADNYVEYLRGRGGWALGLRVGAMFVLGAGGGTFSLPVTVVGHWGVPAISVYGGVGYTPYARDTSTVNDVSVASTSHGVNALAGTRFLLRKNRNSQLSGSVEVIHQAVSPFPITSVSTSIGLHF